MNDNYALIAHTKQHADQPHLLPNGAQTTVNTVRCHSKPKPENEVQ
jgi:hypothetical protein